MNDTFYRAFEDRHRGAREMIAARLRVYLPFITPLAAAPQRPARALDVGCGRGEWLELAAANGFAASGVDLDDGMLASCRARGLDVRNADALATLRAMDEASLAVVSAFHVVEHIPFDDVRALMSEALRALQPGGILILETPNPENLVVGATSFYLDPSHLRPLPPDLLSFAAEHAGFGRVKVLRLQEEAFLRGAGPVGLRNVLAGASPDYAVVAQKAAAPEVLAQFDGAFAPPHGISFDQLANRYDEQLAQARGRASALAQRVERDAESFSARAGALEAQLRALEARVAGAEAQANQMGQQVIALLSSRSWRVTAPLRAASRLGMRVRSAWRQGTLRSALRRRAGRAVRALGRAVLRNPRAKRACGRVLGYFPGLRARVRNLMYQAPVTPGGPLPAGQRAGDLSPRAQRAYRDLKQALQRKGH